MADETLKRLLQRDTILVAPGAFDMVSAKIIEHTGFEAVYMSGFGQSASHLGFPDVGLLTFSEIVERVHNTTKATKLPVLADGDTGYGGIVNVRRTVQDFELAGASAIQLEDQEMPKRCGHTKGKRLIDSREMVMKIEAAIASRRNDDFLIIARTDARSVSGMDEALRRGKMYEEAGADIIFFESPLSRDELKKVAGTFEKPALANMAEGGKTPLLDVGELQSLGFKIVVFPITCLLVATEAMKRAMQVLKAEGSTLGLMDRLMGFEEFNRFIGFPEVYAFEKKFRL